MIKVLVFILIDLLFYGLVQCYPTTLHEVTFSDQYTVSGYLSLPYAEIREPFAAYYDGIAKRSRIDYYGGQVKTYQRSDLGQYGTGYKVAPMTTEGVRNKLGCFLTNGTTDAPIKVQSILPDVNTFKLIGKERYQDMDCLKLQLVEMKGLKKNTYTMYVTEDEHVPVRYEMFGYDTLLGSHYDKYYLDYFGYSAVAPAVEKFYVDNNKTCGGFPGPGIQTTPEMNPMREYIHRDDVHVHVMFNDFVKNHGKEYSSSYEHEQRKHNFRHNLRFINSKNRAGLTYRLAPNHFMDQSQSDLRRLRGYHYTPGKTGGINFDVSKEKSVPETKDWRIDGAVTPVKDQANCGSCWSFGTTGTIEGAYFVKTGKLIVLSQQELMDCSWGEGNNACDGGEDFRAYAWIKKHGLSLAADYGPYLAKDGYCHNNDSKALIHLSGFVNVTQYSVAALKAAIANHGPVSIAIDAAHLSLSFYSHGVYYEPACGNRPDQLDHAVLAVGYGTFDNKSYWLVKNSWSTYWGNDGYVLMSQENNNCGVLTSPTYPVIL